MLNQTNTEQEKAHLIITMAARVFRLALVAFCLVANSGCSGTGQPGDRDFSWSIAEAKKKGSLVCEVEIIPNSIAFAGKKITFEAAWLERLPDGDYALCLRVDQGKEIFKEPKSPFFVRGDRNQSFDERLGRGWVQFIERLQSDDLSSVRASLIQSWKQERQKDIRFVRKD